MDKGFEPEAAIQQLDKFSIYLEKILSKSNIDPFIKFNLIRFAGNLNDSFQFRFAKELEAIGYTTENAIKLAKQIIPKPIMYALMILFSVPELKDKVLARVANFKHNDNSSEVYTNYLYAAILPIIYVYLIDQTLDEYNPGEVTSDIVTLNILDSKENLIDNPEFDLQCLQQTYFRYLRGVNYKIEGQYRLLLPLFGLLEQIKYNAVEMDSLIRSIVDVITPQHLVKLAWDGESIPQGYYNELVATASIENDPLSKQISPNLRQDFFARYSISDVGLTLVTEFALLLEYLHNYLNGEANTNLISIISVLRQNPQLIKFLRISEALVRIADDLSDYEIDMSNPSAPSLFKNMNFSDNDEESMNTLDVFFAKLEPNFEQNPWLISLREEILKKEINKPEILSLLIAIFKQQQDMLDRSFNNNIPSEVQKIVNILNSISYSAIMVNGTVSDKEVEEF